MTTAVAITAKATVTTRALIARINRKLGDDGR